MDLAVGVPPALPWDLEPLEGGQCGRTVPLRRAPAAGGGLAARGSMMTRMTRTMGGGLEGKLSPYVLQGHYALQKGWTTRGPVLQSHRQRKKLDLSCLVTLMVLRDLRRRRQLLRHSRNSLGGSWPLTSRNHLQPG